MEYDSPRPSCTQGRATLTLSTRKLEFDAPLVVDLLNFDLLHRAGEGG